MAQQPSQEFASTDPTTRTQGTRFQERTASRTFLAPGAQEASNACVLSHYRHFSFVVSQAIRKKMVVIMRTIALSLTLLALPVVPTGAVSPAAATKIHWVFDIVRGNDKIGTDTIDIERQNDTTTIKIKKDVSVKVMFIEAYRYEHSCNETWKNGQLVAFKSRTNDNGTKHSIDVTAAPDKLSMDADGKHSDLPKTAAPASLWGKDAIHQFDAFNPDTGKRLSMKVTEFGEEVLAIHGVPRRTHHYKIADTLTGDFVREMWFDGDVLVRTKIIGSDNSVILSDLR
jgi:hypothetical protein